MAHYEGLALGAEVTRIVKYDHAEVAPYVERVGIEYPGRYNGSGGAVLVPPGMIFFPPARTFGLQEGPAAARGGFFTASKRTYHRTVLLNDELRFEGTLTEKFERGGYFYIVVGWSAFDTNNELVATGTEEHTLGSLRKPRP